MTGSASGHHEVNPEFLLPTQACEMGLSRRLESPVLVLQERAFFLAM